MYCYCPFLFAQPNNLRSEHRPLALKQSIPGGVLQSISGIQCFSPLSGSPNSAFIQVTPILWCFSLIR